MQIYYRALRRLIWVKFGTSRQPPPPPQRVKEVVTTRYGSDLRLLLEGGGYGRTGWIALTSQEVFFISGNLEKAIPFSEIVESKISKGPWYDYVLVATKTDRQVFRIYKCDKDVSQDFFNQVQLRLGAVHFPAH